LVSPLALALLISSLTPPSAVNFSILFISPLTNLSNRSRVSLAKPVILLSSSNTTPTFCLTAVIQGIKWSKPNSDHPSVAIISQLAIKDELAYANIQANKSVPDVHHYHIMSRKNNAVE